MKGLAAVIQFLIVAAAAAAGGPAAAQDRGTCDAPAIHQVRSMLYFGMSRPKGSVSEGDWQAFLRDVVTPRFPAGLTVLDGQGQWRGTSGAIDHEHSKVLILDHADTAVMRRSIQEIIAAYRKMFDQEAVMWERNPVCVVLR